MVVCESVAVCDSLNAPGRTPPFRNDILPSDVAQPGPHFELLNDRGEWVTRSARGQIRSASSRYLFVKQGGKIDVAKEG